MKHPRGHCCLLARAEQWFGAWKRDAVALGLICGDRGLSLLLFFCHSSAGSGVVKLPPKKRYFFCLKWLALLLLLPSDLPRSWCLAGVGMLVVVTLFLAKELKTCKSPGTFCGCCPAGLRFPAKRCSGVGRKVSCTSNHAAESPWWLWV